MPSSQLFRSARRGASVMFAALCGAALLGWAGPAAAATPHSRICVGAMQTTACVPPT